MRRNRSKRCNAGILVMLLAGGLLVWFLLPRQTNLWKHARLLETEQNVPGRGAIRVTTDCPYCWISSDRFFSLQCRNGVVTGLEGCSTDVHTLLGSSMPTLSPFLKDHPFPIRFLSRSGANPVASIEYDVSILVSPDGRWMLWSVSNRMWDLTPPAEMNAQMNDNYLMQTDGKHITKWSARHEMHSCLWLRDKCSWVTLGERKSNEPTIELHSLADPGTVRIHPVPLSPGMMLIGITPDEQVVTADWQNASLGQISAAAFRPDADRDTPRRFAIPIPPGQSAVPIVSPMLSPKGDRIAWFVALPSKPLGWPTTQKFWGTWKIKPESIIGLWTTRLDGSDPQEVGHYVQKSDEDIPSMLQWTPDSKMLSFRNKGVLYGVPAQ